MKKSGLVLAAVAFALLLACASGEASATSLSTKYVGNTIVDLEWSEYSSSDFSKYEIWRDGSPIATITNQSVTFYRDSGLTKGVTYKYKINVYNATGGLAYNGTTSAKTGDVHGTITRDTTWTAASSPYVQTGRVTVQKGVHFTIQPGVKVDNAALYIYETLNVKSVSFNGFVKIYNSDDSSIQDCSFNCSGTYTDCLLLDSCNGVTIIGNTVSGSHWDGIVISEGGDNVLTSNTANNNDCGIELSSSSNNILTGNNASNNNCGIWLSSSSNSNTLTGNTAENNNNSGIWLDYSSGNTLTGNNASNNSLGIWLLFSSNSNTLTGNNANNNDCGIWLDSSSNSILTGNTAENNNNSGILLSSSSGNTLTGNNASNNSLGIWLSGIWLSSSSGNLIYNNYFANNTNNAYDDGNNTWNITKTVGRNIVGGPYLGGNYWSDYSGTDADGDGLGDTPYIIGVNKDYLPLIMYQQQTLTITDEKTDKSNYTQNEPVTISCSIKNDEGDYTSADSVNAKITKPDDSTGWIFLGEEEKETGRYEGNFSDTDLVGDYDVTIYADKAGYVGDTADLGFEVKSVPVLLVHGYCGSPDDWSIFKSNLEDNGFDVYTLDYAPGGCSWPYTSVGCANRDIKVCAKNGYTSSSDDGLAEKVEKIIEETGADKIDIVAHSMGGLISRWYIQKEGGAKKVRQLIMIGTPNHGTSLADWEWLNPDLLPFPKCFGTGIAANQMKPKSPFIAQLNYNEEGFNWDTWMTPEEIGKGVTYRNIAGTGYKTPVEKKDVKEGKSYKYRTKLGDGVVPIYQLKLSNVGCDCYTSQHGEILNNPQVINRVIEFLKDSSLQQYDNCPTSDPDDDHFVKATDNRGYIYNKQSNLIKEPIDSTVKTSIFTLRWEGSDLNLTLISPSGRVINSSIAETDPDINYTFADDYKSYHVNNPEFGNWTINVTAIDVPLEGESYTVRTFYVSPLILSLETGNGKYSFISSEQVTIRAYISTNDTVLFEPELVANITAEIKKPDGAVEVEVEVEDLILYDDGLHNDCKAKDGIFGNTYDNTTASGTYDIVVTASGTADSEAFKRIEIMTIWVAEENIFDTGAPANPYPSLAGTHNGTLTPSRTITVNKLYTYPCVGTGGHSEYARVWNFSWNGVEARWSGYAADGDWQNLSFNKTFTLLAGETYNYTVRTGSYPQIHHTTALRTANGWLNCSEFIDANGKVNNNRIPAIKLF